MIMKSLDQLGLRKTEAVAYIGLIENGAQTAGKLSKIIKVNRTTCYGLLKSLAGKGFVTHFDNELGVTYYKAVNLENLIFMVEKEEARLENIKKDIKNSISEYKLRSRGSLAMPKVSYFEGLDGLKSMYLDTINNNHEKQIMAITDYEAGYSTLANFIEDYYKLRTKNNIRVLSILPDSKKGREDLRRAKALLRQMKFIPLVKNLNIEINIYDDKVAISSFNPESIHGVLIQSETIAMAMKNIFGYIWKDKR